MKRFAIALAVLLALTHPLPAQSPDASGQWELTVPTSQGPIAVTMVLKKADEKLTGTLKAVQGEATGEGTQKGAAVALTFKATTQQGESVIVMNGTQDGDAMKGTLVRDNREPIEFTGKRGDAAKK